jgi:PTS system nitrogen regulatory IIA component
MDLIKSLSPENILVGVKAADKWDLMRQMLDCIVASTPELHFRDCPPEEIFEYLKEREQQQSTGVGEGFALPHARIPGFPPLTVCLATLDEDLDYGAIDGKPVRVACMVLTSAEEPEFALKIMSALSSVILNERHRARLQAVKTREEAHAFLSAQHLGLDKIVHAEELMMAPSFVIHPDTSISEVTTLMMQHNEAATAVQDTAGNLVGEITSDLLFQYGMPDFFKQLQSVSFVKNFNPLEKFFAHQTKMNAGDLMTADYAEVGRQNTLIEVIFLLSVKQRTRVYVTDAGKLVGTIGRIAVLDRAVNF